MYIPKPTIEYIPSGYKVSKGYFNRPINGKADAIMTRNSEATRVNKEGIIDTVSANVPRLCYRSTEKTLYKNLVDSVTLGNMTINTGVTYSDELNLITPFSSTVKDDGGLLLDITLAGASSHDISFKLNNALTVGETYTLSIYIKHTQEKTFKIAYYNGGTSVSLSDNLTTSSNGEWNRYTYTFVVPSGTVTTPRFRAWGFSDGDDGDSFLIYGAQVESGDKATDYQARGVEDYYITRALNDYPAHLIEPLSRNTLDSGETFNSVDWVKDNVSLIENSTISPDGTPSGVKIEINTAGAVTTQTYNLSEIDTTQIATCSIFVKKGNCRYISLINSSNAIGVVFDLFNNTAYGYGAVVDYGYEAYANGWYRIWFHQGILNSAQDNLSIRLSEDIFLTAWTDAPLGAYAYIWGGMVEDYFTGIYPSSYISNTGTGATERVQDIFSNSALDVSDKDFQSLKGVTTIFELLPMKAGVGGSASTLAIRNTAIDHYTGISSTGGNWRSRVQVGASAKLVTLTDTELGESAKIFQSCDMNGYTQGINGVVFGTGTDDCSGFSDIESYNFYGSVNTGQVRIKRIRVWNERLSDEQIIYLTKD